MEIIITCALFGTFILLSFTLGLHYGSKVKNNQTIGLPGALNPIKTIKEQKEQKELKKQIDIEQEIERINLENIENYNGSEIGQQEFPDRR